MEYNRCLFYLALALVLGHVYSLCEPGWVHHDKSCYLLHSKDKYNWIESQIICEGYKAHLVFVGDNAENTFLKGLIVQDIKPGMVFKDTGDHVGVWVGASDYVVEGQYVWYGTNEPITFTDWYPGEPNNHAEDCIEYYSAMNWKWADGDCHSQHYFICEKQLDDNIEIVG